MTATAVFVHGRRQEARDPEILARGWLAALNTGLGRAGLPALAPERVSLPYYGTALHDATAELAGARLRLEDLPADGPHAGAAPGTLDPDLPADVGELERRLVADMAAALSPDAPRREALEWSPDRLLSWDAARRLLSEIALRTRTDQWIITVHLRDVAVYLTHARDEVLAAVRRALPAAGPVVLVSHSLGTVVARDLLAGADVRDRTVAWITAGSPLGLEAVQRNMRPPGARHPGPAVPWFSAYDVRDVVALGHPLRPAYGEPLTDIRVENGDAPHLIERYLAHADVARPIGEALARG
ncbi:hypothetical protein [Actinomadura sp. WAC 06369]|uniref:hypothetical protein n=1 Tax=Actinomadura sp. WAC 06369 TaxID=2203193 RepID=UPI000F79BBA2|nr:hypothetical protein [Actinomadura sp. WAC 06369]RSN64386.1 hypothetical protein DMH08_17750 [Actinomadura sp. WAC 06369]